MSVIGLFYLSFFISFIFAARTTIEEEEENEYLLSKRLQKFEKKKEDKYELKVIRVDA